MYPYIRDIFQSLGWKSGEIKIDISVKRKGMAPDLAIVVNNKGIKEQWIVVEAKSYPGLFRDAHKTREVLLEKKKYLSVETEWFILVDPHNWRIVPTIGYSPELSGSHLFDVREKSQQIKLLDFLRENLSPDAYRQKAHIQKFLTGDTSRVGKIEVPTAQYEFFKTLEKSFQLLFDDTKRLLKHELLPFWEAMEAYLSRLEAILNSGKAKKISDFVKLEPQFMPKIQPYSGENVDWEQVEALFDKLNKLHIKAPNAFKMLYDCCWLQKQKLTDNKKELIAFNTSLLLLSKMITIRFLEDYSFFGGKRFFSNGGLAAFEHMKKAFDSKYTDLIKHSARGAVEVFPTLAEEGIYDWVLDLSDDLISQKIQHILYWLSFYNFSTIKGDVLSQIYTQTVPSKIRKKLGQVFTPFWLASYIVRNVISEKGSSISVLDPACGSGTFLVAFYDETVGKLAQKRKVTFDKAKEILSKIHGNDIDPFASAITKLHLAWRLLDFEKDIKNEGFPTLKVSVGDALEGAMPLFGQGGLWSIYDLRKYDAVIGNPPYVRPEIHKLSGEVDEVCEDYTRGNLRTLFMCKAIQKWLDEDGMLGFVLPLSFFDSEVDHKIRNHLRSEYTIKEIFDLETASKLVFPEVSVNPTVLILKKQKPRPGSKVRLKFLESLVNAAQGDPDRILDSSIVSEMLQDEIFTEDGRILTKITPQRLKVINHIKQFPKFKDIARRWWRKKDKKTKKIVQVSLNAPEGPLESDSFVWEVSPMIGMGLAFRRKKYPGTWRVYKGENISCCDLHLDRPSHVSVDVKKVDDPSFWRFPEELPDKAFAFLRITLAPTAAPFNPRELAFENTATIFFPSAGLSNFPFDFLVISDLYRFYYSYYLRVGTVNGLWSNLYARALKELPWSEELSDKTEEIFELREQYINACALLHQDMPALLLEKVELMTVEQYAGKRADIEFRFSERGDIFEDERAWFTIKVSPFDWMQVNNEYLGKLIESAIKVFGVEDLNMNTILRLPIPATEESLREWESVVKRKEFIEANRKKSESIQKLNRLVYQAYGIDSEMEKIISESLNTDFAMELQPIEPYSFKRLRGRLKALESPDRYSY